LRLKQVVLDFEGPVVKKIKHVFGSHVYLTGCIVQYTRSQRRKHDSWDMKTKPDYKVFTESLKALAYVPPESILRFILFTANTFEMSSRWILPVYKS